MFLYFYRSQKKLAKVMFLHLGVGGGSQAQARGVSRPRPGGRVQAQARGCVSQHALRQTPPPPQQTATAADGTHPNGMYSCL